MNAQSLRRSLELKKLAIRELAARAEACETDARLDEIAFKIGKLNFQIRENEQMLRKKTGNPGDFISL